MVFPWQRPLRTDPKKNTTPLLPVGRCLGMDSTKNALPHCCADAIVTDPKGLTPKKTPPLHSNSPPLPSNTHTHSLTHSHTHGARQQDGLTDWPSVIMWLWLHLSWEVDVAIENVNWSHGLDVRQLPAGNDVSRRGHSWDLLPGNH
jgi:hypothetical protein